jgi:XRE family transcriptional regulator of biofilm formation
MIGDRVKELRKEKGISLTELADKAGVAKSYLSSLERNLQQNPSIQFLEKISNVLNVPTQTFLLDALEQKTVDPEWVNLAEEAKKSGISKDQFREFIEFNRWRIKQK